MPESIKSASEASREKDELDNEVEALLEISMTKQEVAKEAQTDTNYWSDDEPNKENFSVTSKPIKTKSIMKKPGTPIVGKRLRNQAFDELFLG